MLNDALLFAIIRGSRSFSSRWEESILRTFCCWSFEHIVNCVLCRILVSLLFILRLFLGNSLALERYILHHYTFYVYIPGQINMLHFNTTLLKNIQKCNTYFKIKKSLIIVNCREKLAIAKLRQLLKNSHSTHSFYFSRIFLSRRKI